PLKEHKLLNPCKKLQENICSCCTEVMKMLCCTDQQCTCNLGHVDELKGHDTASAAEEKTERKAETELVRLIEIPSKKIVSQVKELEEKLEEDHNQCLHNFPSLSHIRVYRLIQHQYPSSELSVILSPLAAPTTGTQEGCPTRDGLSMAEPPSP
ncbi:hypothetical protein L3Q82_017709, partial [Scortum barcoo]